GVVGAAGEHACSIAMATAVVPNAARNRRRLICDRVRSCDISEPPLLPVSCLLAHRCRRGSSASRSPSPTNVNASIVTATSTVGASTRYQYTWAYGAPSEIIFPQLGIGS